MCEKKCPFCGGEISASAKKCKHCKKWLDQVSLEENISNTQKQTMACPFCGGEISASAKKCKHCKKWLEQSNTNKKNEENISNAGNQTTNCPFCGGEISATAKKCRHCKKWINDITEETISENKEINSKEAFVISSFAKHEDENLNDGIMSNTLKTYDKTHNKNNMTKIITILICSCLLILLFAVPFYIVNSKKDSQNNQNFGYKNVTKKDIISLVSAESNMAKSLKKSKSDKVFINFINKLNTLIDGDFEPLYIDNLDCQSVCTINDFTLKMAQHAQYGNDSWYTFINPKIDSIYMTYIGEGSFWFKVHFEYLKKKYSLYLSDEMNEYLDIRIKQDIDLNHSPVLSDAYLSVGEDVLLKWILDFQNFMEKYPKFELNKEIKKDIRLYTSELVWNKSTFNIQTNRVDSKTQKVYQDYINKADKNTEEYKFVRKAYYILKKNDFKYSDEFNELYQNFSNNKSQDYSIDDEVENEDKVTENKSNAKNIVTSANNKTTNKTNNTDKNEVKTVKKNTTQKEVKAPVVKELDSKEMDDAVYDILH